MTLSNRNLMMLSKFATKAKKHIGLVKAAEMFNDRHYASDILIQATLSDSMDLISLTKRISSEFNVGVNLISATESYIKSLTAKNATDDFIHDSKYFLRKLTHHLYEINIDGASYRQAVEKLLSNVELKERTFCINLARGFYRFWRDANKSISEIDSTLILKQHAQKEEFIKLWEIIEDEFFSDSENWPLTLYIKALEKVGTLEKDIQICQKIAKVIIVELRNNHNQLEENYRSAIDNIEHQFLSQELRAYFLIVSREFYHFWIGNIPKIVSVV